MESREDKFQSEDPARRGRHLTRPCLARTRENGRSITIVDSSTLLSLHDRGRFTRVCGRPCMRLRVGTMGMSFNSTNPSEPPRLPHKPLRFFDPPTRRQFDPPQSAVRCLRIELLLPRRIILHNIFSARMLQYASFQNEGPSRRIMSAASSSITDV